MEKLSELYATWKGCAPLSVERLPKAGSNRHYARFTAPDGSSAIGVVGPDVRENASFVYLSRHFAGKGLPVPEILAVSEDCTRYLQTDLGAISLYQAVGRGREAGGDYDEAERALIRRTIRLLPHIQVEGAGELDFGRCLPPVRFDSQAAMFDLNYFKYCFLRTTDLPYDELRLEADLRRFADDLADIGGQPSAFLYRDFQARNVMLKDGAPHFIDYQGGMQGPLQYDVASFLWQASARYSHRLREEMIGEYLSELSTLARFDEQEFRDRLRSFVLFRLLQVLGAYGLRGYFERKQYFIDSIPPALQSLRRLLLEGAANPYPYLEEVLRRMVDAVPEAKRDGLPTPADGEQAVERLPASPPAAEPVMGKPRPLVVRVFSFSYKRGIPADESGNGGGYVFDCRDIHNPGRYEAYKRLTGLDAPVVKFLEENGEAASYLSHVLGLADAHVERYLRRGFTDLMFSFGCTGGQHRSVYCAHQLARHISAKYGVEVRVCHREQRMETLFPAREAPAAVQD